MKFLFTLNELFRDFAIPEERYNTYVRFSKSRVLQKLQLNSAIPNFGQMFSNQTMPLKGLVLIFDMSIFEGSLFDSAFAEGLWRHVDSYIKPYLELVLPDFYISGIEISSEFVETEYHDFAHLEMKITMLIRFDKSNKSPYIISLEED